MVARILRVALVTSVAALGWTGLAEASTISCSSLNVDITNQVTNTSGCQYSDTFTNDPASPPIEVNEDAFFGFTDWILAAQGTGPGGLSGSWSVTSYTNYANYQWLIVFKDGALSGGQNGIEAPLVGYLAAAGSFSGTWLTPFVANVWANGVPTEDKAVSHISYYYRQTGQQLPIPEPATLLLLGTGLAFLAHKVRRRPRA